MAKVVQFPVNPAPEKFGLQRARKKKCKEPSKQGQLNLFSNGRVIKLNKLTAFEEALLIDEQGDKKTARILYQKAIEAEDCIADCFCNLGIIDSQEGNYPKAIDSFTQALKHNPRHYEAHYNLANLYAEVGNYALAKLHYEIAIELEPSFPNSYYNLGLSLALMKLYDEAVKVLSTYCELTPDEEHQQISDLIFKLSTMTSR
ncbi:tetratricopeptide repeat protein [Chryseosolibacter indicus]|uniref:Tetratricopeptide repeat protein n=1 Tax=Chryseosolibacter indicus TaxID=2782351 RepID=A0ABS5VLX7_9BACT|nr:tetratricopeptide repeat protein [Chryseosolibacter indicus]MBT1701719.1 tetratricopeptide repeat protein [Chryseosolibacter indicus]